MNEQLPSRPPSWFYLIAKRCLDLAASSIGLLLLSPLIGVVALVLRHRIGSPILFRQARPGWMERPFVIYKFRTMADIRDADGKLLPDEVRMTRAGGLIRRLSLDELPPLWNVVRGDMRLVGPRPLLLDYLDRYSPEQRRRHEVKPGITGWTQINGRNSINWEHKFALDVWYVRNASFKLDLAILARTFIQVFKSEGISSRGHATMPEFVGEPKPTGVVQPGEPSAG